MDLSQLKQEQICSEKPNENVVKPVLVGLDIGKKKTKKLIIKPKKTKKEATFNNVFTNRLKVEATDGNDFLKEFGLN